MIPLIIASLIALGIIAFLIWPVLGDGREYLPNQEELRWLRSLSLVEEGRLRAFGRARMYRRGNLNVLKLCGSHYEMGYQHGVLLREQIHKGALLYFADPTRNFAPFKHMHPVLRWLTSKYFDWTIFRPLLKCSPKQYLAELKGLADGSGLSFARVFRGNMLSDLNMNLIKVLEKKALGTQSGNGCTSFAAFGNATQDGSLIMGRNTDYAGGGLWDKHQAVLFYEPDDGYKFVSVTSAGLLKCNSCMNEKGLCLGAHFLFLTDTRADGVSFTFLEIEIMKKAATVQEALDIVSKTPRAGAFAFLLCDGKTNEAAVIEAGATRVGVRRPDDGAIWETNMATTPEVQPVDVFLRNGIGKNPIARFERMRMLLSEHAGHITPALAARFMGDHMDMCSDSTRPVGTIISQISNQTSVVFCPASFDFWVADGLAPVCNNPYTGFNLLKELAKDDIEIRPHTLEPNEFVTTADYRALRKYYDAMVAYLIPPCDQNAALQHLEEAIALRPNETIYRRLVAKMLLRSGDAAAAADHLTHALDCPQSPNELAQTHLLRGFTHDLRGNRDDAVKCYTHALATAESASAGVLGSVNPLVQADALTYSKTPFTLKQARALEVSFEVVSKYDL
ncbi:MAG: hypothetical protein Kow0099_12990 [Candidatus Abyssubacteria bacterium]